MRASSLKSFDIQAGNRQSDEFSAEAITLKREPSFVELLQSRADQSFDRNLNIVGVSQSLEVRQRQ